MRYSFRGLRRIGCQKILRGEGRQHQERAPERQAQRNLALGKLDHPAGPLCFVKHDWRPGHGDPKADSCRTGKNPSKSSYPSVDAHSVTCLNAKM